MTRVLSTAGDDLAYPFGGASMKCCKTCQHSRWSLTPTGRIPRVTAGMCVVPLPVIPLPYCVTAAYGYRKEPTRCCVEPSSGKDCPLWEQNEGKPIADDTP